MDIGDLLNILLATIVIVIAILLALHLPKMAYGVLGQENPFAIYQIAISLNYFSSFPGEFSIKIHYPGIVQCESRIATFHRNREGKIDKGNSYVSEGFCEERNHIENLKNTIISALFSAIPVNIPGLEKGVSAGKLIVGTIVEAGKIFLWNQIISFIATVAIEIMSGNPIDLFSSFIKRLARERLSFLAQVAVEKGIEFAQILVSVGINVFIRAAGLTGPIGYFASFVIHLFVGFLSDLWDMIRGTFDPAYNCLKGEFGVQYVYIEYRKVYYSQNLHVPLNFVNITIKEGNNMKKLAELTDDWLYKIFMTESIDNKVYVLSEINIYTKDGNIWVEPKYQEMIKQ